MARGERGIYERPTGSNRIIQRMDPRLEAWIKEHCGPLCYGEQDENGIDLSLIRSNLKLTPLERIRRHDAAVIEILELQRIGREHFGNTAGADR